MASHSLPSPVCLSLPIVSLASSHLPTAYLSARLCTPSPHPHLLLLPPAAMAKKSASGESSDVNAPQNSFQQAVEPAKRFAQDSYRLVKRCTKPDAKEFKKIALATTVGFLVMGFLGFFVKLVHIPSQTDKHTATAMAAHHDRIPTISRGTVQHRCMQCNDHTHA